MKLQLSLSGKKLFPLYLGFYALFVFYMVGILWNSKALNNGQADPSAFLLPLTAVTLFILGTLLLYTPFLRLFINSLTLGEQQFSYDGKTMSFFGRNLLGIFLSIITIGIYTPWYIKKIYSYVTENISLDNSPFAFKGTGKRLFVILLLTLVIPVIAITVIVTLLTLKHLHTGFFYTLTIQVLTYLVLVPYIYYVIKWSVDFVYKDLRMTLNASPLQSMKTVFIQIVLGIITIGIYMPVAYAKLFVYFGSRISVQQADSGKTANRIQADLDMKRVFLLSWGQALLTIVSLGFYGPWAIIKIYNLYLDGLVIEKVIPEDPVKIEGR